MTYLAPFSDLGLCNLLDGHVESVAISNSSIDSAEATLAEDGSNAVGSLEGI